jgi:flagellar basal-body rod protein FlgB
VKTLFDSVDSLQDAMTFHRERHGVLSGNLANLDTPGYQPKDLERQAPVVPTEGGIALAKTDAGHMDLGGAEASSASVYTETTDSSSADGNAISLEREMAKIAANKVRYSTTTEVASRRLALLRYAATDGNG